MGNDSCVMKISELKIRDIIKEILLEQFTIPKHSKHSGFDLYTEKDGPEIKSGGSVNKKGAGFLVCKIMPENEIRFLGLVAPEKIRSKKGGYYDIPKGNLKKLESEIEGAKRECFEECGIKILDDDIISGSASSGNLVIFPAVTNQNPAISPNPESGVIEHEDFKWLTKEEIEDQCLDYLKPIVKKLTRRILKALDKN